MIQQPMLAAKLKSLDDLRYPCLATPKLDGIRCIKRDGVLYARSLKPIRNRHIINQLEALPDGLDGELLVDGEDFHIGSGAIRKAEGSPCFKWWVFDWYSAASYADRIARLTTIQHPCIQLVLPTLIESREDFAEYFDNAVTMGYEGVCTRTPDSPYKFGRSTATEQYLVKHKPWEDSEMRIESLFEQMENTNDPTRDELGRQKRLGGKSNHVPKDTLGGFIGHDIHTNLPVRIGSGKGLTQALRQHIWDNASDYVGRIVKYQYMKLGSREKPRMPRFIGFREPEDM